MLTSGVPGGFFPVSQCLHSRYKGLRPRNLPGHSFCPGCSVHRRARERAEVRTHAETIRQGTLGHRHVLSRTHLNTAFVQSEPHLKPSALRTDRGESQWRRPPIPDLGQELPLSIKGLAPQPALVQKSPPRSTPFHPANKPWRAFHRGQEAQLPRPKPQGQQPQGRCT